MRIPSLPARFCRSLRRPLPRRSASAADASCVTMAFQRKKPAAIGVKAPLPGFIEPALASSIEKVPSGERWLHEIKFDGYRVQVHLANQEIRSSRAVASAPPANSSAGAPFPRRNARLRRRGGGNQPFKSSTCKRKWTLNGVTDLSCHFRRPTLRGQPC